MSKIGTSPQNQTMTLNTLAEAPVIQEDRDQDGVYKKKNISIWMVISYISSCSRCVHRYVSRFGKCIMHIIIFVVYYYYAGDG